MIEESMIAGKCGGSRNPPLLGEVAAGMADGGGRDRPEHVSRKGVEEKEAAEEGMAQMSELFKEKGSELYMGQGEREHD
jgi:phosphomethylpyrimidine synthase